MNETHRQVAELARIHLGWKRELPLSSRLVADLGLDSLQRMTLAVEVENHFEICLDPEDEEAIESIGDLVETIERKREAREEPTA